MPTDRDARPLRRSLIWLMPVIVTFKAITGCSTGASPDLTAADHPQPLVQVRHVRVLIASGKGPLRFRATGRCSIRDDAGQHLAQHTGPDWVTISASNGLTVGRQRFSQNRLHLVLEAGATFELASLTDGRWSPPRRYAGSLLLLLRQSSKKLLAVNQVDLDTYIAGVLSHELYPDFHAEAFRAQAVASRTYALYQMSRRAGRDYDLTNTQMSQVYGGLPRGPAASRAVEAASHTRGIVCTWSSPQGEQIFCTYYCSACGGRTQSGTDFLGKPTEPPLAGGVRCNFCRIARGQVYRWGPIEVDKSDLNLRLKARHPDVFKKLGSLKRVEVLTRTDTGRIARLRLIGPDGDSTDMLAERFRLLVGSKTMRSTACYLQDIGSKLVITDGRGFGHGVGLCQWGAHGQALQGRSATQILKFYYPGANLTKAY